MLLKRQYCILMSQILTGVTT